MDEEESVLNVDSKIPKVKVKVRRKRAPKVPGPKKEKKKIKLKLTAKEGSLNNNGHISEDEEEPEPALEEHLILRLPEGEMCDKLHEYVRKREIPEDIKLHFKDSRRGYFYFDGKRHDTTLVDLPTIIESQKTLDKKQFYKIADISQMLVVDNATLDTPMTQQINNGRQHTDPYMYPHGLTPPLKYVRKRRFRKKLSKRAIEEVEREVERLLEVDATAEDVTYEVIDSREEMEMESDAGTQDIGSANEGSDSDADMMAAIVEGLDEIDDDEDEEDNDDDEEEDDDDEEEEEEEEEEDSEEEEEEEESGQTGEIEQKQQEIDEIEQAIERKKKDVDTAPNAMLKKRFETSIESLKKELALKQAHLAEMRK